MLTDEQEAQLIDLLGLVYGSVRWRKMGAKNPWDVWNHRIRAAATRPTLDAFISRLSNQLGLQSLPVDAIPLLDALRPVQDAALELVYREHIPVAMRAVLASRERTARRKAADLGPMFNATDQED